MIGSAQLCVCVCVQADGHSCVCMLLVVLVWCVCVCAHVCVVHTVGAEGITEGGVDDEEQRHRRHDTELWLYLECWFARACVRVDDTMLSCRFSNCSVGVCLCVRL